MIARWSTRREMPGLRLVHVLTADNGAVVEVSRYAHWWVSIAGQALPESYPTKAAAQARAVEIAEKWGNPS